MRLLAFTLFALIAVSLPADGLAQEEEEPTAYWYVTQWQIPWAKVDSLRSLEEQYTPAIEEAAREVEGTLLDRKVLIHDTGTEWNVMILSKYPSWQAIRDDVNVFERAFPDEAQREGIDEAFSWVFEGALHRDAIYVEIE